MINFIDFDDMFNVSFIKDKTTHEYNRMETLTSQCELKKTIRDLTRV